VAARQAVELPLTAEPDGPLPMAAQLAAQLRAAIADGRVAAGERLPATRALAASLGVSRTVVTSAYAQLFAEGWIEGRHGSGTFVSEGAPGRGGMAQAPRQTASAPGQTAQAPGRSAATLAWHPGAGGTGNGQQAGESARSNRGAQRCQELIELRPGIPWAAGIDQAAWRRAWRLAGHQPGTGLPCPGGLPELRQALPGYLRRSRGVLCTPDHIMITRGVAGGLAVLAAALLRPGDLVGAEEPGYPVAREIFAARGARVIPCRADRDGLVVSELPAGLRMVYTTPAHQYPLGGRLPVPRRQALIAWARATGALILEDDYDGEFRYDVAPLPALHCLDPQSVVYLGTTTKTLTTSLRTGWLVARPGLVAQLAAAAVALGDTPALEPQRVIQTLMTRGDLERHIRRMRHEYARRRAAVVEVLGAAAPGRLRGDTAGMHIVLELPPEHASHVAAAASARGVSVRTLRRYFSGPAAQGGLVIGYGGASLGEVTRGCQILAEILREEPVPVP
jgi:GntR family transcriptional regulator/MocR family aminotransferase